MAYFPCQGGAAEHRVDACVLGFISRAVAALPAGSGAFNRTNVLAT